MDGYLTYLIHQINLTIFEIILVFFYRNIKKLCIRKEGILPEISGSNNIHEIKNLKGDTMAHGKTTSKVKITSLRTRKRYVDYWFVTNTKHHLKF